MRAKRRRMHGKKIKKSPLLKDYDFTKKKQFGEGKIGKKIVDAVTPKSATSLVTAALPVDKIFKAGKAVYNYVAGND